MNHSIHDSSAVYNVSSDTFNLKVKIISTTACAINLALGVPTNIYVLWLMVTGTEAAMASEFFSLNLTVAESVGSLFGLGCLLNRYPFHLYLRGLDMAFLGFMSAGRPLFQCLILLHDPSVTLYVCLAIFSVLFAIKMFCSLAILWTLRRASGPGERPGGEMNSVKLRAFMIVLLIMAAVAVNYIPLLVTVAMYDSLEPRERWFAALISCSFSVITGFVNPLLYLHRVGKMSCDCRV